MKLSKEDLQWLATTRTVEGFTKAQLAKWGVPWPPPKGWKDRLLAENGAPNVPDHKEWQVPFDPRYAHPKDRPGPGVGPGDEGPSEARTVPLMVVQFYEDGYPIQPSVKFYVSKVKLQEGLKFIAQGNSMEQRQARRRKVFADLIAASHK